jgi:integrase
MEISENGLVTSDGTKVLTVEEFDRLKNSIHKTTKALFELNVITGLRYVEVQRLHENPTWYHETRNQIILPKRHNER